eukprot:jgi/Astpho2/2934/Aster-01076
MRYPWCHLHDMQAAATTEKPQTKPSQYELQTLTTWLLKEEQKGRVSNELATVLSQISVACKQIASLVCRAGIADMTGVAGLQNISGEDQKKLDVISNEVFSNCLRSSGRTGIIASEEEDEPVAVEETFSGDYIVVFDPLDGSSNLDANISTGSIFGIYEPSEECRVDEDPAKMVESCIVNVCQPGSALQAAGYCLYSSSTVFVLTLGHGVYGFTLDPSVGEFILSNEAIQCPQEGKIYAFNEGNYQGWTQGLKTYIDSLKDASKWGGTPYSARYIGSLVGDFHRTLLYGGIYGYPGDKKNKTGKLRLLYECAPMSFIMEQAGGSGSTGDGRVLDVCPEKVHQRVPLFVGSKKEVEYLEKCFETSVVGNAVRPAAGLAATPRRPLTCQLLPCSRTMVVARASIEDRRSQVLGGVLAGLVGLSTAMSAHAMDLRDDREVRQRGFDIIYEARDLDLDQSERDGLTQYRTNIDSTKKRIKESEKRIDNVLPGKIQKKYWTEAREELRNQVGNLRFDLNTVIETSSKSKADKKDAQFKKKEFLAKVDDLDYAIRKKDPSKADEALKDALAALDTVLQSLSLA